MKHTYLISYWNCDLQAPFSTMMEFAKFGKDELKTVMDFIGGSSVVISVVRLDD